MNDLKVDLDIFSMAMKITEKWDFNLAIEKILESKSDWDEQRALKAVQDYKRYMALTKALDGYQLVPNGDIDEIWHYHILDTRAYFSDCNELFGQYLHHYPYFGMLSEENHNLWKNTQDVSTSIWFDMFGEVLYKSDSATPSKCPQVCPCNTNGNEFISAFSSFQKAL